MPQLALRKSGAQSLINHYSVVVDSYLNSDKYSIEAIRNSLQIKLREVEKLSLEIYSKLGYSGGSLEAVEAQFNYNIQQAKKGVEALTGIDLQTCFLDSLKKATGFNLDFQKQYENFVSFLENQVISKGLELTEKNLASEFAQNLKPSLDGMTVTITEGRARVDKGFGRKISGTFAPTFKTVFTELSKSTQIEVKKKFANQITLNNVQQNQNFLSMEWLINNVDINSFFKMSPDEKKQLLILYPNLPHELNIQFKNEILSKCSMANQSYLSRAIDKVVKKKIDAFFVGGNIKDMTGILGEIQGLYYLLFITNGKIDSDMGWVGGVKNPHSDILLRDGLKNYGIQVKNTSTPQLEKEIEFQSFGTTAQNMRAIGSGGIMNFLNTDNALKTLNQLAPYELFNAIESILAMEVFNIEYQWDSKTKSAYAADNADFADVRQKIEIYSEKAQKIAQLFSVSMMYMQTSSQSNQQSNILYFVAGGVVRSAGTILKKIIDEINSNLHSFRVSMKNRMNVNDNQKTIVDFLNSESGHHDISWTFQSSYNFY